MTRVHPVPGPPPSLIPRGAIFLWETQNDGQLPSGLCSTVKCLLTSGTLLESCGFQPHDSGHSSQIPALCTPHRHEGGLDATVS